MTSPTGRIMSTSQPRNRPTLLTDSEYGPVISAYLSGSKEAADQLARLLTHHAQVTVDTFLKQSPPDAEDLVQDTVISVLDYLKRRGEFSGSLVNFTISVARNRCRSYAIWRNRHATADLEPLHEYLVNPGLGPLDLLAEKEVYDLLQQAMDHLKDSCRDLLRALYVEGVSIEEMMPETDLKTVQGLYYRRARCLKLLGQLLKNRLLDCSSNGGTKDV